MYAANGRRENVELRGLNPASFRFPLLRVLHLRRRPDRRLGEPLQARSGRAQQADGSCTLSVGDIARRCRPLEVPVCDGVLSVRPASL